MVLLQSLDTITRTTSSHASESPPLTSRRLGHIDVWTVSIIDGEQEAFHWDS